MKLILAFFILTFAACGSKPPATMEFASPTPAPVPTPVEYTPDSQVETEWDTAAKPSPTPIKKHKKSKRHLPPKEDLGS